jgi:hypothetical protein
MSSANIEHPFACLMAAYQCYFSPHFTISEIKIGNLCAARYIYLSLSGLLSFKSSRLFLLALIVSLLLCHRLRF